MAGWTEELASRLRVKPGVTGMWQVSGRSTSSFDDYIRHDLYYVDNWTLLSDLAIVVKTIPVVLFQRGAYQPGADPEAAARVPFRTRDGGPSVVMPHRATRRARRAVSAAAARGCDCLDVPVVGAAAATEHRQVLPLGAQVGELTGELLRVALVEDFALVELGVTQPRRVRRARRGGGPGSDRASTACRRSDPGAHS